MSTLDHNLEELRTRAPLFSHGILPILPALIQRFGAVPTDPDRTSPESAAQSPTPTQHKLLTNFGMGMEHLIIGTLFLTLSERLERQVPGSAHTAANFKKAGDRILTFGSRVMSGEPINPATDRVVERCMSFMHTVLTDDMKSGPLFKTTPNGATPPATSEGAPSTPDNVNASEEDPRTNPIVQRCRDALLEGSERLQWNREGIEDELVEEWLGFLSPEEQHFLAENPGMKSLLAASIARYIAEQPSITDDSERKRMKRLCHFLHDRAAQQASEDIAGLVQHFNAFFNDRPH